MDKIIKSSQHSITDANIGKKSKLEDFIAEYHRMTWWFVDYIWNTKIEWSDKILDINNGLLDVPNNISTINIPYQSDLSARAIKLASSQALALVKSRTNKRRKQLYVLNLLINDGNIDDIVRLKTKIDENPLIKPKQNKELIQPRLDSNCCKFIANDGHFDGFLKLSSIGKKYGTIYLPIKWTKHSNRLVKKGYELKTTWSISKNIVSSTWEKEKPIATGTKIIGADQGLTTCLSLSDGQVTKKCLHGHDLTSIIAKMSKQQKGSKAFGRSQEHRTNYINWSIKQLNLTDVKELRLERLHNVRYGKSSSQELSHWTYTEIDAQIISLCLELGVPVIEQSATYRSQRCSDCGWTQKSNRNRKVFICKHCGSIQDADTNGAKNHSVDLPRFPVGFWRLNLNRSGFFWLETGLFNSSGQEITVPDV